MQAPTAGDKDFLLATVVDPNLKPGHVVARHYATGEAVRVAWAEGVVTSVEPAATATPPLWIAPALVDLQVNGYAGVDFQQDGLSSADLLRAARALQEAGCSRFFLTLVTSDWTQLVARLRHLSSLRGQSPALLRGIAGWHIEGPFLSASPGFHGAHDPTLMIDPRPDHIRELRDCVPADPLLLTLSPERPGALESIALAKSLGMTVSLGHTDASGDQLRLAVQAGASGFTHLGNGCPQLLDRHDNILWRVLDTSGLTLSLIPDGHHVSPPLFRLIHRAADPNSLFYVTDAMAAAGCPPGRYRIGALDLEVGADGAVRQPGRTNFAGSSLRPCAGVARAARMRRCSWRVAWDQFSLVPARFAGLPAGLRPGGPADLCLIQVQPEPDG